MKKISSVISAVTFALIITISSCGNNSNEATGDEAATQDTSLMNNYNNDYPNNRIHMKDSNNAGDSAMRGDTVPMKPAN